MELGSRDRFGVPANFFGRVDDDFYGIVGRVVMVAAVLEDRLATLRAALCLVATSSGDFAGESTSTQIMRIRSALVGRSPEIVTVGSALMDRTSIAFDRRNEVVHSLWPNPTMDRAYGHRGLTKRKQVEGTDPRAEVSTSSAVLTGLINELADLYSEVRDFEDRLPLSVYDHVTVDPDTPSEAAAPAP